MEVLKEKGYIEGELYIIRDAYQPSKTFENNELVLLKTIIAPLYTNTNIYFAFKRHDQRIYTKDPSPKYAGGVACFLT